MWVSGVCLYFLVLYVLCFSWFQVEVPLSGAPVVLCDASWDRRPSTAPSPLGCCIHGDVVVGLPIWVVLPMVLPFVHAFPMYGVTLWVRWAHLLHPPCGRGVAGGGSSEFCTGPLRRLTGLTSLWDFQTLVRLVSLTDCSLDFYSSLPSCPGAFFFFFMNGNTERAQCALSRVCIPLEKEKKCNVKNKTIL